MKSCDNPLGCACYEANGYSLTDCEYFVEIDSQEEIIEDDTPDWVYDAQAFDRNGTFTKSATFDKLTQDSIPKELKLRMKADREKAQNTNIIECPICRLDGFENQAHQAYK